MNKNKCGISNAIVLCIYTLQLLSFLSPASPLVLNLPSILDNVLFGFRIIQSFY